MRKKCKFNIITTVVEEEEKGDQPDQDSKRLRLVRGMTFGDLDSLPTNN